MGDFTDSVKEYQNLVALGIAFGYGAYKVRAVLIQIGHKIRCWIIRPALHKHKALEERVNRHERSRTKHPGKKKEPRP